ncbi:MAG TPA: hypothetical protein VGO09_09635 [Flavisolibacter sp.]|nr:hypothetical protein [Flavisolibacter sp.]
MDNLNDIKNTWLRADVNTLPKAEAVVKAIKNYRLMIVVKNSTLIVLTLVMLGTMCWVLFAYKSGLVTTRIGEACFFMAIFILLVTNTNSIRRIQSRKNYSNEAFLIFLKQEQLRQINFQKRTQVIGFALGSIGLVLYIFELVYKSTIFMAVGYSLLLLWLLVCWFILRPKAIKRKNDKFMETIRTLERLSNQLSNN